MCNLGSNLDKNSSCLRVIRLLLTAFRHRRTKGAHNPAGLERDKQDGSVVVTCTSGADNTNYLQQLNHGTFY